MEIIFEEFEEIEGFIKLKISFPKVMAKRFGKKRSSWRGIGKRKHRAA